MFVDAIEHAEMTQAVKEAFEEVGALQYVDPDRERDNCQRHEWTTVIEFEQTNQSEDQHRGAVSNALCRYGC